MIPQGNDRVKALIKLLQTESDDYGPVLKRELAAAIKADPARVQTALLEEFKTATPLSVVHTLEEICWEDLASAIARFAAKINPDLEEGLTLLSKFTNPGAGRKDVSSRLDEMARELRPSLLKAKNHTEIAGILSHYFFNVREFQTLTSHLDVKDISFFRFLRKKRGSSLCAACLYVTIGQRYGLDVNLVDLAGRILVHLWEPARSEALFIDPLDNGKILSLEDCHNYIHTRQIEWTDDFLSPLSSRVVVRRFISNMIYVLNKQHDERRLKFLREYLEIIKS